MNIIKFSFIFLFLMSCAHIKNGYHVQRQEKTTYSKLASIYNVSLERLQKANGNKKISELNWVFIPRRVGFLGYWQLQNNNKVVEADSKEDTNSHNKADNKKVYAEAKDPKPKKLDLVWPVPAAPLLSSRYGMRKGRMHHGIDIPAPKGTKIVASDSGKVIYSASRISGYGKMTILAHEDDYLTVYAHATKNLFKEGDYVKQGDVIALVGRTGRATGNHLHYEVRRKDKSIDPLKFLKIPKKKSRRKLASRKKRRK